MIIVILNLECLVADDVTGRHKTEAEMPAEEGTVAEDWAYAVRQTLTKRMRP